jgi:DNA-binding transcriptional ArsR family regulator
MSYEAALEILADPTRRAIVERLRRGPAPVVDISTGLPVSRPAVSKHLRLMKEAGLVRMTTDGTRHIYELDLAKLDEVRRWLDGFWDKSLQRFKQRAEREKLVRSAGGPGGAAPPVQRKGEKR